MKRQAMLDQSQIIEKPNQSVMMAYDAAGTDNVSFNESLNLSYLNSEHNQNHQQ